MKKFLYILLTWLFYLHTTALSQNPEWINYTNGDDIYSLALEGDILWVGTAGGLVKINRLSGNKYFFNRANSELPSNRINCVDIDSSGNIWIGTDKGLVKFDDIKWTVYNTSNSGLPDNEILCLAIGNSGSIWIGTGRGLVNFDNENWTVYNGANSQLPDNWIYCLATDNSGAVWIGTRLNGIAKFYRNTWTVFNTSNSELPDNVIDDIAIDDSNNKWIGTFGGLTIFDDTNWTVYNTTNSPVNGGSCFTFDNFGNTWMAYEGLVKFDGVNWTFYNESNSGLPNNKINCIVIDNLGIKWIGTGWYSTVDEGLVKFDDMNWTLIETSNSGLPDNWIYHLTIDKTNTKWISAHTYTGFGSHLGNGLTKFDDSGWTAYDTLNSGLTSNTVVDIAEDSNGNKWIATQYHWGPGWIFHGGLVKYDGLNWTVYDTSNSNIPTNHLNCIAIDNYKNKWIGTIGEGLVKFDGTDWTIYNTSNSGIPNNYVGCIAIDDSGNIWLGSEGLVKFDRTNWTTYNTSNSDLPTNNIYCITVDKFNNKWIGTTAGHWSPGLGNFSGIGLVKYDGTNWTVYDTSNSTIPSNVVTCLAIDKSGDKWVGTSEGLAKFDDINWTIYNVSNSGLPNNGVNCISIDAHGNKWIGTWNGLALFAESGVVSVDEKHKFRSFFPNNFQLSQNYPNPFNPLTKIKYHIPKTSNVVIKVFDILGNEIETLVNEVKPIGTYELTWNAANLPSGVYFYQEILWKQRK